MSVKVTVKQLQQHLPEILNRTVAEDDVCVSEKNGQGIAVIVRLDALGAEYRLTAKKQPRTEELLAQENLPKAEEKELAALLNEAEEIMLRRAQALDQR